MTRKDWWRRRTAAAPPPTGPRRVELGSFVGLFAERLLTGHFPWAKLRQGHKLVRLADRYSAQRLDAACERALAVDLIDVTRVERMLKQAHRILALGVSEKLSERSAGNIGNCQPRRFEDVEKQSLFTRHG